MAVITVPKILREKLTDEGADALVELFNNLEIKSKDNILEVSENKFERRLIEVKKDLEIKISEVKTDLETKIAQVKADLETKIAQSESKIIKWMFIFWMGQVFSITAILFAFFKR